MMVSAYYGSGLAKVPLLLLALAAGYGALVLSKSQERPLDKLGRFVGGLILLVSFIGLLCVAVCGFWCGWAQCHGGHGGCTYSMTQPVPSEGTPQ